LPREGHKHSNNSVAYSKSGTIDYVAQGGAQTLQQLDRLPQEWYNRLLHPKSGTNTPNNSVADPKSEETSYGKVEKSHKERQGETFPYYSKTSQKKKKDMLKSAHFSQRQIQKQGKV